VSRKKILRVALYPYDDEMYPYLRCSSMLDGIKIQYLLSPKSWGVEHMKVCGYDIHSCPTDDDYDKIDALWICDSIEEITEENLLNMTEEMLLKDKQLIITRKLDSEIHAKILDLVKNNSGTVISDTNEPRLCDVINENYGFLDNICAPIISVSGVGENTDKFLAQLLIKECLEKNDYRVALISSRDNCDMLKGVYPFPKFMEAGIPTEHKIILYNRFVKRIEKELNPDYIIVGIQGGILPSLNINVWNFELYPYAIFKAVKPLYSVMCLYGNHVSTEYLHELRQIMRYKFDADVDFFYRSSTRQELDMVFGKSIFANLDETAYIYDDISKICDIIMKK
jgi:peptide maturation system protein (TIGR04066 family)